MIRERWSNFHGAGWVGALHPVQVQSGRLRVLPRNRQDLPCLVKRGGNSGLEGWMEKLFLFSQVEFVLDYTPKFIVPPIVYEKVWMHPLRQTFKQQARPPGGLPDEQSETKLVRWARHREEGDLPVHHDHARPHHWALPHHHRRLGDRLHRLPHLPWQAWTFFRLNSN